MKILIFFIVSTLLASCGPGMEEIFSSTVSPDDSKSLRITVSEPKKLLGCEFCRRPFYVSIYLLNLNSGDNSLILETRLENDGVAFSSRNIVSRWMSNDIALVCLRASDLPKKGFLITIKERVKVTETKDC